MSRSQDTRLVVIVGQTASGKSGLAMKLAKATRGEIIAADSRTVYRGLDIGTAKPTKNDQLEVPHHLVDVADQSKAVNVAKFKRMADEAIADIRSRGGLPILVGGSGLYVDSVVYDYSFAPSAGQPSDSSLRERLEKLTVPELQRIIKTRNLELPENSKNKRYLVRTIEKDGQHVTKRKDITQGTIMVGLQLPKELLEARIRLRLSKMVKAGLLEEVEQALIDYPEGSEALKGNIYRCLKPYFEGENDLASCYEDFVASDIKLAKKQITWFKRNMHIDWYSNSEEAFAAILKSLKAE